MENEIRTKEKFVESITFKALVVGALILIMLIPNSMIQGLILERKIRSKEVTQEISEKWSLAQKVTGPILVIPYTKKTIGMGDQEVVTEHTLYFTPNELNVEVELFPEERYLGIYKTIVYQSLIKVKGNYLSLKDLNIKDSEIHWDQISLMLGISDLRGVANNTKMNLNGNEFEVKAGQWITERGKALIFPISKEEIWHGEDNINYSCELKLNGSEKIEFIPVGKNSHVVIKGAWQAPGFIGHFSPAYTISEQGFEASWNVLDINRAIPVKWTEKNIPTFSDTEFGVHLVETVDHYQQNMRSAKYSMLFIALTFLLFFFVELLTKKKIHPVQYFLVGLALMIFYSLLLSISEQIGFGIAYFIASTATITLITSYTYSIFKNIKTTAILLSLLIVLYAFLYLILQTEDVALLIGSIGLFIILGIAMYASKKVKWYKNNE